ncbi:MAG: aspartate dehydrogenase [Candidatus Limivivens sp.]|nr:aspartate dehydrogenase [Candidatus Limivivens sp.]
MLFQKKKKREQKSFDRASRIPAVRASICTGERVAGFQNLSDGKFEEVTLIRNDQELEQFMEQYGIQPSELRKIY